MTRAWSSVSPWNREPWHGAPVLARPLEPWGGPGELRRHRARVRRVECVFKVHPVIEGRAIDPRYRCGQPVEHAAPAERLARWRSQVPQVETDHEGLRAWLGKSAEDLGALRIFDPDFPERVVVAAGAPWFMTVFGRDSLLTAWMALIVDPDLARGRAPDPGQVPGRGRRPPHRGGAWRILHEMRFGGAASLSLGGGSIYYGTADATPLFVMLLGEMRRWGVARWRWWTSCCPTRTGHASGSSSSANPTGTATSSTTATDRGLANQGWKDSWDGIRYADGTGGRGPDRPVRGQAYTYGAYLATRPLRLRGGGRPHLRSLPGQGDQLKAAFNRDFWLEDRGGSPSASIPTRSRSTPSPRTWATVCGRASSTRTRPHRVAEARRLPRCSAAGGFARCPHHRGLQPDQLSLRLGVAARHGDRRGRPRPVRDRRRRPAAHLRAARCRGRQGGRLPELFSGLDRTSCASRAGTRPRAHPRRGRRRLRCCACGRSSGSIRGSPTARPGCVRTFPRASAT